MRIGRRPRDDDPADELAAHEAASTAASGPFDAADVDDDLQRLDFGSVQVPAVDGMQIRVDLDEGGQVGTVAVLLDETAVQFQAFAAPRSAGIWDDVRAEIRDGIAGSGGRVEEVDGPFGAELRAVLPVEDENGPAGVQPVRFLGVDGPRWFLRCLVTGPGAEDERRAAAAHALIEQVVVDRGQDAAPPREPLPLRLPDDPALQPQPPD